MFVVNRIKIMVLVTLFLQIAQIVFITNVMAEEKQSSEKVFQAEVVKQDLEELYKRLEASHYDMFVNRSREEYDRLYQEIQSSIKEPMTEREVRLLFQRFVAFGTIAHARVDLPSAEYSAYRKQGGRAFPLYIKVIDGKAMVVENYSYNSEVHVGAELLAINDEPVQALFKRLRAMKSADTDYMFHGFLELELPLLLWLEYGEQQSFDITLKQDGKTSSLNLKAVTYDELVEHSKRQKELLQPQWSRVHEIHDGIGYLRPGPFFNMEDQNNVWDYSDFEQFIEEAFSSFREDDVKALLIDLRNNPGGDNSFSDLMVRQFASREFNFASSFKVKVSEAFIAANEKRLVKKGDEDVNSASAKYHHAYQNLKTGDIFEFELPLVQPVEQPFNKPVYVLVNRHSYSNAVTVAALVQDYEFATIIGEETSDLATTYGAMETFDLSRTGITIGFPKAHIIRPSGNTQSRGVVPDITIKTPLVEYSNDVVLQKAMLKIKELL